MNWAQIVLICLFALNALVTVASVGKPRPTITGGTAALTVVFAALFIWVVVLAGRLS